MTPETKVSYVAVLQHLFVLFRSFVSFLVSPLRYVFIWTFTTVRPCVFNADRSMQDQLVVDTLIFFGCSFVTLLVPLTSLNRNMSSSCVLVHVCRLFSEFTLTWMMSVTWLSAAPTSLLWILFFLFVCLFCRSLTSNLPNVNLPNVNLQIPKVPNLPVPVAGLSVNLPQMPSFSTPSWMAAIYDSECVFYEFTTDSLSRPSGPWYEDV